MAIFLYILALAVVVVGCKKHENMRQLHSPHQAQETQNNESQNDGRSYSVDGSEQAYSYDGGGQKMVQPKLEQSCFSFFLEFLYFKAIQDGLKYAQLVPQTPSYTPISSPIDQTFKYSPGSRIGISFILPNNKDGEIRLNWMYYYSHPHHADVETTNFSVLAVSSLPTYGIPQNQLVDSVVGKWRLIINAFELDFNVPLQLSKRFRLSPAGGIKAGFIDQHIQVDYADFQIIQPTANTPQEIKGKSHMWGVGPLLGLEGKILLPSDYGVFFKGSAAALAGRFRLSTSYKDFLLAPAGAKLKVTDHKWRVSVVEQFQAGLDKTWKIKRQTKIPMEVEIALGWEVQVWTRQMRLNMFDTFVEPSDGSDLTLYGPFARFGMRF